MDDLRARRCVPCTTSTPKLGPDTIAGLAPQIPCWTIDGDRLRRRFRCPTFMEAIAFVQRMAEVAEAEDHHPDFCVHYRDVEVTVWTHAVGGLTENDFVLAAKIDGAFEASGGSGREK